MTHESSFVYQVQSAPEVTVRLRKMTYGRRGDLLRKMGELTKRAACLAAGASEADQVSAEVERHDADRILMAWAIETVEGLTIDGRNATAELLMEAGPEEIVRELLGVVHREIGLSPEEIKN